MKLGNSGKIGLSWAVLLTAGIYAFYRSKESIVAQRVEHMRTRERMYASNSGEYQPSSRKYAN